MTDQLRKIAEAKSQIAFPVPELHMLKEIRKERRIGYVEGFIAAQPVLDAEADLRDVAHISCDCVPDLGPEHCHLCSDRAGHEVTWTECSSHLLAPERVRTWLQREFGSVLAHDPHNPEQFWGGSARALCEAAKRGELYETDTARN